MVGIFIISALGALIFYYFFGKSDVKNNYPPGPRGLPYVGSLFSLGKVPHITFNKWATEYGPIVMTHLGTTRTVILNNAKLIREAFNDPVFSGRPDNKTFQLIPRGRRGILSTEGNTWAEQRRFTLRNLRDFGFGKQGMEAMIMEEVTEVKDWLKSFSGKPVSVNRKFSLAVLNSLWAILTSERSRHDDPELNNILDTAQQTIQEAAQNGIPLFFPELSKMFPRITGWTKMVKAFKPLTNLFDKIVEERLKNPGDPNNPKDFMDVYINEINKTTNPESSFYGEEGINSLRAVIGDLHGAGSETTSNTLTWAVLYLMTFPKVQAKFHEEIDRVIGKARLPCLADKSKMPYTEAITMEVFRYSTLLPMGVFHSTLADTIFHGYFIPKDTMVIPNQQLSHFDPEVWGDPDNFRPERFLSSDGKSVVKHESLIPFTVGKRVCLGEILARDEFFLFLTTIFQQFQVNPDSANPASLEPEYGFLTAPKQFTVVMKDRLE